MRSVSVVLPASTCAMTPMFLSLFFIANPSRGPMGLVSALQALAGPPSCIRYGGSAAFSCTFSHGDAKARAQASRAPAIENRGDQLVVRAHSRAPKNKNPGRRADRGPVRKAIQPSETCSKGEL